MRLEQLFLQLDHFMSGSTVFDKRAAISILLDILMIFHRNDLKSEVLKELERHTKILSHLTSSDGIDSEKLYQTLNDVKEKSKRLYLANGKAGAKLLESDLFKSISQRSTIPGGMCSFDLPEFHYWLAQNSQTQQQDLDLWIEPFVDIRDAVKLILEFIRQSSTATLEHATSGFFQLALDQSRPYQFLRVGVDNTHACFAEISGGKHRFSIRFMKKSREDSRPSQISKNLPFLLTRCAF
jgi:cell division protein ZapD